jgi:hypothetical protein
MSAHLTPWAIPKSYIWPDKLHRIERLQAALSVAAGDPVPIAARRASEWLAEALAGPDAGAFTVVWHSVMRQYVDPVEWERVEAVLREAGHGELAGRLVRLSMEPARDHVARMQLTLHDPAGARETRLAVCDDHGLPIHWEAA